MQGKVVSCFNCSASLHLFNCRLTKMNISIILINSSNIRPLLVQSLFKEIRTSTFFSLSLIASMDILIFSATFNVIYELS